MRKDGRFIGSDGSIPEGQGIIHANLNECHELVEMVNIFPNVLCGPSDCLDLVETIHGRRRERRR